MELRRPYDASMLGPWREPAAPAPRPSDWALLKVMLDKHFYVAWKKKRWWGMLLPTVLYSCLIAGGWQFMRQFGGDAAGVKAYGLALVAPMYLVVAINSHMQMAIADLVFEKESKLKVVQAINGLPARIYWLAWFVYFMAGGVLCIFVTLVIVQVASSLFGHSNPFLIVVLFLLSYSQTFLTACCLSILFDRAESASRLAQFISMLMFGLGAGVNMALRGSFPTIFCVLSLMPTVSFYTAFTSVMWLESSGRGLTFETLDSDCCAPGLDNKPMNFFPAGACFYMLALDTILYFLVCWWLDHVWQGEFGTAKSPLFCLRRWCCRSQRRRGRSPREVELRDTVGGGVANTGVEDASASGSESTPVGLAISICDLVKLFPGSRGRAAVDGLSLEVRSGEIFAILGHNGAGKTTTLNCLVGLIPPTSGAAYINGYSITEEIDEVRQNISICPQDSPMYNEFTVDQHLRFFATLRGVRDPRAEVPRVLQALGLGDKQHAFGKTLSGGQKRRLWVATAVIGDAPVIFLDEPTSGMDPSARRELWDLLNSRRSSGRTIVFTTHYLEEADILADRKAVLAKGRVQAVGTSRELKLRFGVGYSLEVELEQPSGGLIASVRDEVASMVRRHVRGGQPAPPKALRAGVAVEAPALLGFNLPYSEIDSFGPLFAELDARRAELLVQNYALEMTSLEEVFMRLGREAEEAPGATGAEARGESVPGSGGQGSLCSSMREPLAHAGSGVGAATGAQAGPWRPSAMKGLAALFWVRLLCLCGNRRRMFQQLVVPSFLVVMSMCYRTPGNDAENPYMAIYAPMGFSMLIVYFTVVVMMDKESKCKFVSMSQGLPALSYWAGTFLFDYFVTLPVIVEVPVMIVLLDQPYLNGPGLPLVVLECLVFPIALLAFAYYVTFLFNDLQSMIKYLPIFNLIFGTIPPVLIYELVLHGHDSPPCAVAADVLHYLMSVVNPFYGLPGVMIYMIHYGNLRKAHPHADVPVTTGEFLVSKAGIPMYLSLAVSIAVCRLILRKDRSDGTEGRMAPLGRGAVDGIEQAERIGDDDVLAEASRLRQTLRADVAPSSGTRGSCAEDDVVVYQDLRHTYPANGSTAPVKAVRGISLGIKRGECFGLLGPNGAGKTTTLSILTGELWPPTSGRVLVNGEDVSDAGFGVLYRRLGNCPQVDPLWPDLSGRQHLLYHGRVKGVPEAILRGEVEPLLQHLGLSGADANKVAKKYSGGMKRKLSLGIALVGRSEILLLDEPSAAVDAAAKRYLWQMIRDRGPQQTALLTTHSMEEAEALCDRLTIQVSGQLRCLGSPIHIRNRYGAGYQLELFLRVDADLDAVSKFMSERVSERATLLEAHRGRCLYQLPSMDGGLGSMGLAAVFTEVSNGRHHLGIMEYSLWRPSLEHVFLRFAREQQGAEDAEDRSQPVEEAPIAAADVASRPTR